MVHSESDRMVAARIVQAGRETRAPVLEGARRQADGRRQARGDQVLEDVKLLQRPYIDRAVHAIAPKFQPCPPSSTTQKLSSMLFPAGLGQKRLHSRIECDRKRSLAILVAHVDGGAVLDQVIDHRELTEPRGVM